MTRRRFICSLFVIISILFPCCVTQRLDTISAGQSLLDGETIVSKQGKFELGFFSPGKSSNRYVGIWYKSTGAQYVWVANRNSPIRTTNARLQMSNGRLNLTVNSTTIWMSQGHPYADEAAILDSGNFVLRNASGIVWQSFDYPTDTWLPGGKLGFHRSSNVEARLVSWRNPDDPSFGNYSLGMVQDGGSQLLMKDNSSHIIWRSGALRGGSFTSLENSSLYSFYYVKEGGAEYLTYNVSDESVTMQMVMHPVGVMRVYARDLRSQWATVFVEPSDFCKTYGSCGPNAICDINQVPPCECLEGFIPRNPQNWALQDSSDGCGMRVNQTCSEDQAEFVEVGSIRLPANPELLDVARNGVCEFVCSRNCSCLAYALDSRGGCLLFTEDLLDLERVVNSTAAGDLFVRLNSAESPPERRGSGKRGIPIAAIVVSITAAVIIITCFCFCFYLWRRPKNKELGETHQNLLLLELNSSEPAYNKHTSASNGREDKRNNQHDLPIFSFSSIASATHNFSLVNKLGEGGFGPVYKGELRDGQFVAVKRLSRRSGQGLEEFRNETELIAKLQHRNLVAILGCCIENDEMILVYEYMPNKSLDAFLFEPDRNKQLGWSKRLHIIEGIAQGLMYLHHYSRVRIVHRDLKGSNILLDAEMNPKISDFGMARIFGGNDSQANTKRIVGTYGYMSPEYAMEGIFSVKSDVFAFGVLLLEILSGKKNTGFYGSDYLSLLGYAWNMWQNDSALELIDSTLDIPASSSSIPLRCIQIGLLCVQDNPVDRPEMSQIVTMFNNKDSVIATPQYPAFTVRRILSKASPVRSEVDICSVNDLTVTQVVAR